MFAGLLFVLLCSVASAAHVNVVLLGATGNLAGKYLWQALFDNSLIATQHTGYALHILGAGTMEKTAGLEKIRTMIRGLSVAVEQKEKLAAFLESVDYVQLKTDQDFANLHTRLSSGTDREAGRLFYLSVPASAYPGIIERINTHARPRAGWLRVAIEKPFGRDLQSATSLAQQLHLKLHEEEIFRVDHYLGKPGVAMMRPFIRVNQNAFQRALPAFIEIAMLETEDCAGRTAFYEETGIIRDVFQNHLTELLALITDTGVATPEEHKAALLASLTPVDPPLLGQYRGYRAHVLADGGHENSTTPTFASVALRSNLTSLQHTYILLTSGKMLHERRAFARVTFNTGESATFLIQAPHERPRVIVEHAQTLTVTPRDWTATRKGSLLELTGDFPASPYATLIGDLLRNVRSSFVDSTSLLKAWELWEPLLALPATWIYEPGQEMKVRLGSEGEPVLEENLKVQSNKPGRKVITPSAQKQGGDEQAAHTVSKNGSPQPQPHRANDKHANTVLDGAPGHGQPFAPLTTPPAHRGQHHDTIAHRMTMPHPPADKPAGPAAPHPPKPKEEL